MKQIFIHKVEINTKSTMMLWNSSVSCLHTLDKQTKKPFYFLCSKYCLMPLDVTTHYMLMKSLFLAISIELTYVSNQQRYILPLWSWRLNHEDRLAAINKIGAWILVADMDTRLSSTGRKSLCLSEIIKKMSSMMKIFFWQNFKFDD